MHAIAFTPSSFFEAAEQAKLLVLERLTAIVADPQTPVREARMTGAVLLRFITAIESLHKRAASTSTDSRVPASSRATPGPPAAASPANVPAAVPPRPPSAPSRPAPETNQQALGEPRPQAAAAPSAARTLLQRVCGSNLTKPTPPSTSPLRASA